MMYRINDENILSMQALKNIYEVGSTKYENSTHKNNRQY